ncbi:hypothetical protein [Chryseobacterium echinoideorum]|uniref:hypothetical protein n=1 Tax=Chryseobacterium echinoideorum TaxID=1549648 RepID=UPI0016244F3B|nr:hypothetical protein [Chryseobacterium echinoideorum]
MQKTNFKLLSVSGVIFFKMTSFFALVCVFFANPIYGKISTSESNDDSKIILSGEAIVFGSGDFVNIERVQSEDLKEIETEKAQIFISDNATVYNIEAFSNVEIKTIKKNKRSSTQKKTVKKVVTNKASIPYVQKEPLRAYYYSTHHPDSISQNQKEKIVFTTGNCQYLIKVIVSLVKTTDKTLYFEVRQNFSYSNPIIKVCHLSGKHSVRPPTRLF